MKKYDESDGVWRTIGGRRVFIRTGQSLASAMKASGKFKLSKKQIETGKKLRQNAYSGAIEDIKEYLNGNKGEWASDEEFINDLSKEWGISKEEATNGFENMTEELKTGKMGKAVQELNEKYGYTKENNNWKEQIKANNERLDKETTDMQNKINEYRNKSYQSKDAYERYRYLKEADKLQKQYYEKFRENERANAKIKVEEPNEKYEYVDSYATYIEKAKKLSGDKYVNGEIVEYGKGVWTGKEYTNDEFLDHLEDSNWHSERRQLLEAGLTNQEMEYVKNNTKMSMWSVHNLTGKEAVDKLVNEAKTKFGNRYGDSDIQDWFRMYKKKHPNSNINIGDFKKWFK